MSRPGGWQKKTQEQKRLSILLVVYSSVTNYICRRSRMGQIAGFGGSDWPAGRLLRMTIMYFYTDNLFYRVRGLLVAGRRSGCWFPICPVWAGWCLSGRGPGSHSLLVGTLDQCWSWAAGRSDPASVGHGAMRSERCSEPRPPEWNAGERRRSAGACWSKRINK